MKQKVLLSVAFFLIGICIGGVDTSGAIDPAARRCNPFYKDGDDVLEEEE